MILVTGASGFIGRVLVERLLARSYAVTALVRRSSDELPLGVNQQIVVDLKDLLTSSPQFCVNVLAGVEVVIHAAGRAHVVHEEVTDPLEEYRKVNRDATLALAKMAAAAGVKRFVFFSSINVNGSQNVSPFLEEDVPLPNDPCSLSKYEAEQGLLVLSEEMGMEVVIIRLPLVYGPGAPGNFGSLVKWVRKSLPLPLGAINNQRSLIALDNLVDFIALCADRVRSPKAANQVFLVSDGEDVSTSELLRKVARAYGVPSRLLPIPVSLMKLAAKLLGKGAVADRLFANLQVDSSKARKLLGWEPVVTMDEQLVKMAIADKKV